MSSKEKQKPGEGRFPGVRVQDVLAEDSRPVPAYLSEQSYVFLGDENIPYDRYTSPEFFAREIEQVWPRTWQWACRDEHIPEPGDYVVYDTGPYSIIVTRQEDGSVRAYHNACAHRGTKLAPSHTMGSTAQFRCPYHGWVFDIDGGLKDYKCEWDFPHVDKETKALEPVQVDTWGGFIFINMDPDAMPLAEYMHPLPDHVESKVFEDRYVAAHIQKELNCNWKIASEAFLEAYHVPETHPQLMRASGDVNTQYDFWGDHVNRLINLSGVSSPYCDVEMTEQGIIDTFLIGDGGEAMEKPVVPEGSTARKVMAQFLRDAVAAQGGPDLSTATDCEIVDSIAYYVFPNQQFFTGISFPIVYRFRPLGMQPDRTLFDLLIMKTKPSDGTPWESAEPVRVKAEESYGIVPGLDPYVAHVYDQDTGNMEAAHEGAMTLRGKGATLSNYQEIRIRHAHQTLEKYLGGD